MFTDNNQNNSLLHISLIIDDSNQTKVYFKPNDNLVEISDNLAIKYGLSEEVKNKIHSMFRAFVANAKKEMETKNNFKSKDIVERNVNRLYYEEIKNKKLKDENKKKVKEKELQNLIDTHTFSPRINYLSQLYAERKHPKIEEKLIRDGEISKEKLMKKKITENLLKIQKFQAPKNKELAPSNNIKNVENKRIQNFFNEIKEKETNNIKDDSSITNKENNTEKKNKNKPQLEIDALNDVKQFYSFGDNQFTPRPLNASQTTLVSNKSKQTYKNIFIQNKEEKIFKKSSFKNINGNESFSSNQSDWNFLKKKDTLLQDRQSLKNDSLLNSHNNKPKEKNNTIFFNPKLKDQIINRNNNLPSSSNRRSSVLKEVTLTKEVMPSITELSYFTDEKQISNNNIQQDERKNVRKNDNNHIKKIDTEPAEHDSKKKDLSIKENICLSDREKLKENKSILHLTKQDKNSKTINKSLSKLYLNSKMDKDKNKNIHHSLYKNAQKIRIKRELYVKEFIKREFSYSPTISKINTQTSKEKPKDFINRLVNSKKIMDFKTKLNRSASTLEHSSEFKYQLMPIHNSISRNKTGFSSKLKPITKEGNNDNSTNLLSTTDQNSLQSNRKYLNTSSHDKSLKDQLEKSYGERRSIEKFYKSSYTTKSMENINKFKLNNLKEIFEVIFTYCDNIDDIYDLDCSEIQENLKEKLIIPCCNKMKQRNLDFNFQNFYLISNEIIENFV